MPGKDRPAVIKKSGLASPLEPEHALVIQLGKAQPLATRQGIGRGDGNDHRLPLDRNDMKPRGLGRQGNVGRVDSIRPQFPHQAR